ncbi:MAG: hypothetical protein IJ555_12185 [Ruminococcus sp.]|nr:hypothetical protein [Ruminococcus sp.]
MGSKNTMDSIKLPEKDKISQLKGGYENSRRVYKEQGIDDFTNAVRANFDSAAPVKMPERTEAPTPKDEFEELIEKEKQNKSKVKPKRGVKVGKRYVAKWLVMRIAVISILSLFIIVTFFPPFTFSTVDGEVISDNIFENRSITQVKQDVLMNEMVYNIDNMTSVNPSNYRICTVDIDIKNFTPYKVELPGFSIVTSDPMYRDKFISAKLRDGAVEIDAFKVKTVTVEVLMNVFEINEEQFDEAMTSLILRTNGMKKKLGPVPIPVIPAFVFVSDSLEYHLN